MVFSPRWLSGDDHRRSRRNNAAWTLRTSAHRVLHNQPLLWTGPRRVVSLFLFKRSLARRVARHRT